MLPIDNETPAVEPAEIEFDTFKLMVDIRAKALGLALQMPNSRLPSTIYKKAEEIERWLTRKV